MDSSEDQTQDASADRETDPDGSDRRPIRVQRWSSLRGQARWVVAGAFLVLVLAPIVGSLLVLGDGWEPLGDRAIIALRASDALSGQAPLLGQPTTGSIYSGVDSWHPGPSEFWLLGPFVSAMGARTGSAVGTGVLSALAVGATLALALRTGGRTLFACMSVGCALFLWSLGLSHFADPVNSELVVVFLPPAVMSAWAILRGDLAAVPIFVAVFTVAAQAHVAGATGVLPLGLLVVGAVGWHLRRADLRAGNLRWLGLGALLLVAGWLPPVLYELGGQPSNLSALWRTATTEVDSTGWRQAFERLATAVGPVPIFARRTDAAGFAQQQPLVTVVGAGLVLGAVGSLTMVHRRSGRKLQVQFVATLGLALAAALWGTAGTPKAQQLRADAVRWMWALGMLVWVLLGWLAWTAWLAVDARSPRSTGTQRSRWLEVAAVGVSAAVVVLALATTAERDPEADGELMPMATAVDDHLAAGLPEGSYRVVVFGSEAYLTFLPGVVAALEGRGSVAYVDLGTFSSAYGDHREFRGQDVDGTLFLYSVHTDEGDASSVAPEVLTGLALPDPGPPLTSVSNGTVELAVFLVAR